MLFNDWQVSIVLFLNKYVLGEVSTLTYFCVHVEYVLAKLVTRPLTCMLLVPRCMQGIDCFRPLSPFTAFSESCSSSFCSQLRYFYLVFTLGYFYKWL